MFSLVKVEVNEDDEKGPLVDFLRKTYDDVQKKKQQEVTPPYRCMLLIWLLGFFVLFLFFVFVFAIIFFSILDV